MKSNPVAPTIIGRATKKENSAAVLWSALASKPPDMVEPAREKPGMTAKH